MVGGRLRKRRASISSQRRRIAEETQRTPRENRRKAALLWLGTWMKRVSYTRSVRLIPFLLAGLLYSAELKPFVVDHRHAEGSVVDMSFLLAAPAGNSGFVHTAGGHLVAGDGKRLRLWGVN